MRKKFLVSFLILILFVMSVNVSGASSTSDLSSDDVIQIYNEGGDIEDGMQEASRGYLSSDPKMRSIGDIVIDWHDLNMSRYVGFVEAEASTQVLDVNGLPEIWRISVYGNLYKNGIHNRSLPSTIYVGRYGVAETSNTDWSPESGDVYSLESYHRVSNYTTGVLEWNKTEMISDTF